MASVQGISDPQELLEELSSAKPTIRRLLEEKRRRLLDRSFISSLYSDRYWARENPHWMEHIILRKGERLGRNYKQPDYRTILFWRELNWSSLSRISTGLSVAVTESAISN